jgi:DNA-binding NarL/FixJ family response regulator
MPTPRILIVDDYEPFRRVISSILQRKGWQAAGEASDGLEAVQRVKDLQPDLVLLDISLPGGSGVQISKQICLLPQMPKVLFFSQECSSDVITETMRSGALGYVQKSLVACDLLPAIEAVLKGELFVSSNLKFSLCTGCAEHLTSYHRARSAWNEIRTQLSVAAERERDLFDRLLARSKALSLECIEHQRLYLEHARSHGTV